MSSSSVSSSVATPLSYTPDISRAASPAGSPTVSRAGSRAELPNVFPKEEHETSAAQDSPPLKGRVSEEMSEKVEATAKKIIPLFSLAKSAYYFATFRLSKARPHFADAKQGFVKDANRFFNFLKSFFSKSPKVSKEESPKEEAAPASKSKVDLSTEESPVSAESLFEELDEALGFETHDVEGGKFTGQLDGKSPTGFGRLELNGRSITGHFVKGVPTGKFLGMDEDGIKSHFFVTGAEGEFNFEGSVKNNLPYTGEGKVKFDDYLFEGSIVKGKLFDGVKQLIGGDPNAYFSYEKGVETFVTPDYTFKGELKDGAPFQGVVTRIIMDEHYGDYETVELGRYSTNVIEGVEEKSGIMKYPHDKIFKGQLDDNYLPHGEGEMIESGISYKGNYVNGMPLGKFAVSNFGKVYEYFYTQSHLGTHQFVGSVNDENAPLTGQGVIYHNNVLYSGNFVDGKFVEGRLERKSAQNPDETEIISIKNNQETLIGKITLDEKFEGTFKDGFAFNGKLVRQCGIGTLKMNLVDGKETTGTLTYYYRQKEFTGTFDQFGNPVNGRGFVQLSNKEFYEGEYDGMCKGKGIRTYADGHSVEANWIKNTFLPGEITYIYPTEDKLHMTVLIPGETPSEGTLEFKDEDGVLITSKVKLDRNTRIIDSEKTLIDYDNCTFIGKLENGARVSGYQKHKYKDISFRGTFEDDMPCNGLLKIGKYQFRLFDGFDNNGICQDYVWN